MMEEEVIEKYKKAGKIAKEVREFSRGLVKEGAKTLHIADEIEKRIKELGGEFAFPTNISINSIAAHSTPSMNDETVLKKGDVVKVDIGVHVDGFIADTAYTVEVGTNDWAELIKASEHAVKAAIELVKPGVEVSKIGAAIEAEIARYGFVPIANLSGHEVDEYELHAGLTIPNFDNGSTATLEEGMVIAIEPFATNGIGKVIDAKESEIFKLVQERAVRQPMARKILMHVATKHQLLPFCKRWIAKEVGGFGIEMGMKELVRSEVLHHYPVLREEKNGMVSQAEHTIIVLDKPIVTTE
jgi:methionyl aminopeptidase